MVWHRICAFHAQRFNTKLFLQKKQIARIWQLASIRAFEKINAWYCSCSAISFFNFGEIKFRNFDRVSSVNDSRRFFVPLRTGSLKTGDSWNTEYRRFILSDLERRNCTYFSMSVSSGTIVVVGKQYAFEATRDVSVRETFVLQCTSSSVGSIDLVVGALFCSTLSA